MSLIAFSARAVDGPVLGSSSIQIGDDGEHQACATMLIDSAVRMPACSAPVWRSSAAIAFIAET